MIILCTQGTGKTYASTHSVNCYDVDIKDYKKNSKDGSAYIGGYVDELITLNASGGFVLGNIIPDVMEELKNRGVEFYIFAPVVGDEDYRICKEILFGRYFLRKNQTPGNIHWINKMKECFDKYCDWNFLQNYVDDAHLYRMDKKTLSVMDLVP